MLVFILIPIISGAIGWVTNWVAIKMLFRPRQPKKILFYTFQGIFPKRKATLATRLGTVVARDLLSVDVLKTKVDTLENRAKLKTAILTEFKSYMSGKFKTGNPLLGMLASDSVMEQLTQKLNQMLDELIPRLMNQVTGKVEDFKIDEMVAERVMQFSDEKFEDMLMTVINKELKFIEIAGAALGFLIGVIQVGLLIATQGVPQ